MPQFTPVALIFPTKKDTSTMPPSEEVSVLRVGVIGFIVWVLVTSLKQQQWRLSLLCEVTDQLVQSSVDTQKNPAQGRPQFALRVGARLPGLQVIARLHTHRSQAGASHVPGLRLHRRILCAQALLGSLGGELSLS